MEMNTYIVYAKINDSSYITTVNSSAFLDDPTDWVKIDEGYGDKYHHAQGHYFPEPIITDSGVYRYKYDSGTVRECTAKEIAEQEANLPVPEPTPSPDDYEARIAALEEELMATKILLGVE